MTTVSGGGGRGFVCRRPVDFHTVDRNGMKRVFAQVESADAILCGGTAHVTDDEICKPGRKSRAAL